MAFRDLKRSARRTLHSHMKIAANYYPVANAPPVPISIRLIFKSADANEATHRYGLASATSVDPKIIFMLDEIDPDNGAVVSLEKDEAYRVVSVDSADDISVIANCVCLDIADALFFKPPGDTA